MNKLHILTVDGCIFIFQGKEEDVIPAFAKHLDMEYDELNEQMENDFEVNWDTIDITDSPINYFTRN